MRSLIFVSRLSRATALSASLVLSGCQTDGVGTNLHSGSATEQIAKKEATLPHCAKPIGYAAVVEPKVDWWGPLHLTSPEAVIKVFVARSGCFRLVDRGKGLDAAMQERSLASDGQLQRGANIGKGQIIQADYEIVPDLVSKNKDASGSAIAALAGLLIPGIGGAIVGAIQINKSTADVVLTVTNTRTTEQVAMEEGHASKTDVGFGGGAAAVGVGGLGAVGAASYENTEIGKVVVTAYLDAYAKLIDQLQGIPTALQASAAAPQALTAILPGHLYKDHSDKSKVIRNLDIHAPLYPTGNVFGGWHEVKTELGEVGWVARQVIGLAK